MSDTKPAVRVRFYRRRNKLKDKTAGLGGSAAGAANDPIEIDPAALAKAAAIFKSMAEDYPDWLQSTILGLYQLHDKAAASAAARPAAFKEILGISHDLKGQGGTFGYPLVTTFAASLNRFASLQGEIKDSHVEIVKSHIDAIRAVIRDRVNGDGGEIGIALQRGLAQVIAKHAGR